MKKDIVIIGGGLVGLSVALALRRYCAHRSVLIVEPLPLAARAQPSFDARVLALSFSSRLIYEQLDLWPTLAPLTQPIQQVIVSEQGHFGCSHISAQDNKVEALGYIIQAQRLGEQLLRAAEDRVIEYCCPAEVVALTPAADHQKVVIKNDTEQLHCEAKLVILADGSRSPLGKKLGFQYQFKDYAHRALTATVHIAQPHEDCAFEHFAPDGPLAFLPLLEHRAACVWTLPEVLARERLAMTEEHFLAALQETFGSRLGAFSQLSARHSYPLHLQLLTEQVRPHLVVLGNAAHTLHPVAGQGFNLCLRDIMALAKVLGDASAELPFGHIKTLNQYFAGRMKDQAQVIHFSDSLVRIFEQRAFPIVLMRNVALWGLDRFSPLKRWFSRKAMGL